MNEITAAIKKKAEQYVKDSTIDERNLTKSEYDAIINDYTCGGEDAIGFMLKFVEWAEFNYRQYQLGKWRKPKETIRYTTEQLLLKYMEEVK